MAPKPALLALTIEGEFGLFRDLTRARDFIVILQLHEKIKILFQPMNYMNFFMPMVDDDVQQKLFSTRSQTKYSIIPHRFIQLFQK